MYLARAYLDSTSRSVRADLAEPEGFHRTVMRAFPENAGPEPRKTHAVLYRIDRDGSNRVLLLLQSRSRPALERFPADYLLDIAQDPELAFAGVEDNPSIRSMEAEYAAIRERNRYLFRLRANTTKKILTKSSSEGMKRNGKRVPVRGDEERLKWLKRRATLGGFCVHEVLVSEIDAVRSRADGQRRTFAGSVFEGVLSVTDATAFRRVLVGGLGPAKAFGFGLLSIRRVK
jgi:CRISPR system Cascade subunit CasE